MLNHLFLRMPIPVVISDIEGTIDLTNDKALGLLGLSATGKEKGLFFDLFAPRSHQGKCISTYLNIFKQGSADNITLEIEVLGKPAKTHIELLNTTPRKLVTMIQTGE